MKETNTGSSSRRKNRKEKNTNSKPSAVHTQSQDPANANTAKPVIKSNTAFATATATAIATANTKAHSKTASNITSHTPPSQNTAAIRERPAPMVDTKWKAEAHMSQTTAQTTQNAAQSNVPAQTLVHMPAQAGHANQNAGNKLEELFQKISQQHCGCTICLDNINELASKKAAMVICQECGQSICEQCIARPEVKQCSFCRNELDKTKLVRNRELNEVYGLLHELKLQYEIQNAIKQAGNTATSSSAATRSSAIDQQENAKAVQTKLASDGKLKEDLSVTRFELLKTANALMTARQELEQEKNKLAAREVGMQLEREAFKESRKLKKQENAEQAALIKELLAENERLRKEAEAQTEGSHPKMTLMSAAPKVLKTKTKMASQDTKTKEEQVRLELSEVNHKNDQNKKLNKKELRREWEKAKAQFAKEKEEYEKEKEAQLKELDHLRKALEEEQIKNKNLLAKASMVSLASLFTADANGTSLSVFNRSTRDSAVDFSLSKSYPQSLEPIHYLYFSGKKYPFVSGIPTLSQWGSLRLFADLSAALIQFISANERDLKLQALIANKILDYAESQKIITPSKNTRLLKKLNEELEMRVEKLQQTKNANLESLQKIEQTLDTVEKSPAAKTPAGNDDQHPSHKELRDKLNSLKKDINSLQVHSLVVENRFLNKAADIAKNFPQLVKGTVPRSSVEITEIPGSSQQKVFAKTTVKEKSDDARPLTTDETIQKNVEILMKMIFRFAHDFDEKAVLVGGLFLELPIPLTAQEQLLFLDKNRLIACSFESSDAGRKFTSHEMDIRKKVTGKLYDVIIQGKYILIQDAKMAFLRNKELVRRQFSKSVMKEMIRIFTCAKINAYFELTQVKAHEEKVKMWKPFQFDRGAIMHEIQYRESLQLLGSAKKNDNSNALKSKANSNSAPSEVVVKPDWQLIAEADKLLKEQFFNMSDAEVFKAISYARMGKDKILRHEFPKLSKYIAAQLDSFLDSKEWGQGITLFLPENVAKCDSFWNIIKTIVKELNSRQGLEQIESSSALDAKYKEMSPYQIRLIDREKSKNKTLSLKTSDIESIVLLIDQGGGGYTCQKIARPLQLKPKYYIRDLENISVITEQVYNDNAASNVPNSNNAMTTAMQALDSAISNTYASGSLITSQNTLLSPNAVIQDPNFLQNNLDAITQQFKLSKLPRESIQPVVNKINEINNDAERLIDEITQKKQNRGKWVDLP